MKKIYSLILIFVLVFSVFNAQSNNISKAPAGTVYNHPTGYLPHLNATTNEVLITHSTDYSITPLNSVSCNNTSGHTENSYFRVFDLKNDFGLTNYLNVTHVEVGIEEASAGSGGHQPVEVRIYTLNGSMQNSNLTLLYSESFSVPDQTLSIYNFVLTNPVIVTAGKTMVVEIYTPDGQTNGNFFFIGSNPTSSPSPSYLSAPDCGLTEPLSVASIGFPDMNIVMNVYGAYTTVPIPYSTIAMVFVLIGFTVVFLGRKRFF